MPQDQSKTKTSSTKTGTRSSTSPKRKTSNLKSKPTTTTSASSQPYLSGADDIKFTMTHAVEHDDGSATYNLDMNEYTASKLIEIGVIALLKEHIEQEKAKKPSILQRLKKLFK